MTRLLFLVLIPAIVALPLNNNIDVLLDEDCAAKNNNSIVKKYAALVKFSKQVGYGEESCTIRIVNPWLTEMQNGFGVFLRPSMDCSSIVTVECLPDSTLTNRTTPLPVQISCHTSANKFEMPCSSIGLTFRRNINMPEEKSSALVQVVALAKEPCADPDVFFQCPRDYPHSCIDHKLRCNGQSECPSGDDERDCYPTQSSGVPVIVIVLAVLACLFLICILSTVLICCCCRAAGNAIIRSIRPGKKNIENEKTIVTGEDAGLMKGLTAPTHVIEVLPQQQTEPAPLVIDSTKPVYPRLE